MVNLREQAESDLGFTLEGGDWGLPVELVAPDGTVYVSPVSNPETKLTGQVLYNTQEFDPDTGMDVQIPRVVVSLRKSSLARVPANDERWIVKIPETPSTTAPLVSYALSGKPIQDGGSFGFVRLYLEKLEQS